MKRLSLLAIVLSAVMVLLPTRAVADCQCLFPSTCCWLKYASCVQYHAYNTNRHTQLTNQKLYDETVWADTYLWSCECHILEEATQEELDEIQGHLNDASDFLTLAEAHLDAAAILMATSQAHILAGYAHKDDPWPGPDWAHIHIAHWCVSWSWEGQAGISLDLADTDLDGGIEEEPDHAEASLDAAIEILEIIEDRIEEEEEEED